MKYSLKNEYKELLNEEVASVKSQSTGFKEKLYNITFDKSKENISSGTPHKVDDDSQSLVDICQQFTTEPANRILAFLKIRKISNVTKKQHGPTLRKYVEDDDIDKICARLNKYYNKTIFWQPNTNKRTGRGEVSVNLAYYTLTDGVEGYNHAAHKEPDFVALKSAGGDLVKYSVKSFTRANQLRGTKVQRERGEDPGSSSSGAQTGTNFSKEVKDVLSKFQSEVFEGESYNNVLSTAFRGLIGKSTTYTSDRFKETIKYFVDEKTNYDDKTKLISKVKELLLELKNAIIVEHEAMGIIAIDKSNMFIPINPGEGDKLYITGFNGTRIKFSNNKPQSSGGKYFLNMLEEIRDEIYYETYSQHGMEDSYVPKGKVLKEIYPRLFKKKVISEGGLAGHMMHPYEALDMTPRQIIDRIKEYSTSQKIIEKVDGQNLFFTVEEDGTLMFARNKEDMTHDDLVEKFTNHPAEVPFVTGGNAIKKGVDQWLSSAGDFGRQEILDIFHPDGEARSFINFEIMHKDHPNQLEYGENFIVFHSIVDFIDGREVVYSSNNSQRLDKLINLMKPGIESSDYTLASNRTVDINKLTNVQILSYIKRVKEITDQLEITDFELLGDGVEKQIKKQLDSEGIDISDEAIKILYNFALYGKDRSGNKIKSKDFTSLMQSEDVKKLRAIDLTNANKAAAKVRRILSPFKEVFVDLGIDLLDGVPSAYMDSETDLANIDRLRDKLETAIEDLRLYMSNTPESNWDAEVNRLKEHYDKIEEVGIHNAVSTSVEGGVYDFEGDLLKVTGGFAPLNQILGAAYRDTKGIFLTFKQKFMQQESNRRSLKDTFNLIF
jgi:hypothetical protein